MIIDQLLLADNTVVLLGLGATGGINSSHENNNAKYMNSFICQVAEIKKDKQYITRTDKQRQTEGNTISIQLK